MAAVVLETVVIERPVSKVVDFVGDPGRMPEWCGEVAAADWLTERPMRLGSQIRLHLRFLGRDLDTVFEVIETTPDEQLVMRSARKPFEILMTYTWRSLSDRACHLAYRCEAELAGLERLATPYVRRLMRSRMRRDLAALKRILESS